MTLLRCPSFGIISLVFTLLLVPLLFVIILVYIFVLGAVVLVPFLVHLASCCCNKRILKFYII